MAREIIIQIPFSARLELYLLRIKVGGPFKSKLRIAIEEIPTLFKRKGCKSLIA